MKFELQMESLSPIAAFHVAGSNGKLASGDSVEAPGGFNITYISVLEKRMLDIPSVLNFVVDASVTIDLSLFSAWLYEKIKNDGVNKIKFGKKTITEITPESIKTIIEEELEINIEK